MQIITWGLLISGAIVAGVGFWLLEPNNVPALLIWLGTSLLALALCLENEKSKRS